MKTFFSLIACFAFTVIFISCSHKMQTQHNICRAAAAGDTVIYVPDQSVALFESCNTDMSTTLTAIMDSRCPRGVNCVWAGTVNIMLQLNNDAVLNLAINQQKDTMYHNRNYSFTLVDVVPYPGASSDAPKAIVRVVQR